ncbi:MAG: hypothetical protein WC593_00930 [Methanoregula sp.]
MQDPSGFILFDDKFFNLIHDEIKSYSIHFHSVFVPRLCQTKSLDSINILMDKKFQDLFLRLNIKNSEKINVFFVDDADFFSTILQIAKTKSIEKIVLINPENLLISAKEIDTLVSLHNKLNRFYSFNHKNYKKNMYATGIGAEIIDTSFLEQFKKTHSDLKNRQDFFDAKLTEYDSGVINVEPERAAPDIDLSFQSIEKYHEISKIIQILKDSIPDMKWSIDSIFKVYRNYYSLKTSVLVENVAGVESALEWVKKAGGIVQFVSLHPYSTYALERLNVPYKTKDDFYDAEEFTRFGMENFDHTHTLCGIIDRSFTERFGTKTIRPGEDNFLNIKILLDVLFIHTRTLQKIIESEKPDSLIIFAAAGKGIDYFHPINNEESVYAEILESGDWGIPIHIKYLGEHQLPDHFFHSNFVQRIISRGIQSFLSQALVINTGLTYKKRGLFAAIKMIFSTIIRHADRSLLIYGSGYNWDECLPELNETVRSNILRLDGTVIKKSVLSHNNYGLSQEYTSNISESIQKYYDTNLTLSYSINLSTVVLSRLTRFICKSIEECNAGYFFVQKYIHDHQIQCLLISVHPTALDNTVVRATRDMHIPVISWQHGGAGYTYLPIMPHIEFAGSDLHLVFGDGVARSYEDTCKKYARASCPPFRPVGSASVDRWLIQNMKAAKKTITRSPKKNRVLFVTTSYLQNYLGVYTRQNQRSWDEHIWSVQKELLILSSAFPDYEFTIKLHPSHRSKQPLRMFSEDHDIKNVRLITHEKPLSDLIDESDILIFDLISTGILEALATTKDLYVYSGVSPVDEYPLYLLKKRAYVTDVLDDFIQHLATRLRDDDVTSDRIDNQNTEFLEQFGVYKMDHNCNNRASEEVRKILQINKNTVYLE